MQLPEQILIVDDEETICITVSAALEAHGFQTHSATDAPEALQHLEGTSFAVALLDLKLPGSLDGVGLLTEIRIRSPRTVVIMMSGHATVNSAIDALRLDAYDYLLKPFTMEQVVQSVKHALAKRDEHSQTTETAPATLSETRRVPRIMIDRERRTVFQDGKVIALSATEFDILDYLVTNTQRIVTAGEIMRAAQRYEILEVEARPIVRVHIQRIRQKLGDDPENPMYVKNIRGRGYRYIGG